MTHCSRERRDIVADFLRQRLQGIAQREFVYQECFSVSDRRAVSISASTACPVYAAKNAADLQSTGYFHSTNRPNQWLCYDFKDWRVQPTHYSIHAHSDHFSLRSWIVDDSLDNCKWIGLDERANHTEANSNHPIASFPISRSIERRFLGIPQTSVNQRGEHWLILCAFEVFDPLKE
jgi:hypothetical protein